MTKGTKVRWSDQHLASELAKASRNHAELKRHLSSQRGVIVDSRTIGKRLIVSVAWDLYLNGDYLIWQGPPHELPAELLSVVEGGEA